jgi:hypothetical protein
MIFVVGSKPQTFFKQFDWKRNSSKTEMGDGIQRVSPLSRRLHELTSRYTQFICLLLTFKQLANTEEFIDGATTGNLGEVLIRCNNVLYVRGLPESEEKTQDKENEEQSSKKLKVEKEN